jgi:DNA-3-methyladenine glycosylase I
MPNYCDYAPDDPVHQSYHATEYGFPTTDESVLMERLAMEIFQAGLSWGLILKKRAATFVAFDGFKIDKVAAYSDADVARLLDDAGIIRNRLKVKAIIHNANIIKSMRDSHGGFAEWIAAHHPMAKPEWVRLFKKTFKFTGGEITSEFLMSIGYLPGTHRPDCPIYDKLSKLSPPWTQVDSSIYD